MIPRFLYNAFFWAAFPYVFFRLYWRSRKQPEYLEHVAERFGFYSIKIQKPLIWIHAVSVGETRAAKPLVERLMENYPGHQILLTHMTPTGRETSFSLYGEKVLRCYLPYDYPFAVQKFLSYFRPEAGILMETEIWFNLVEQCKKRKIPLFLVNARLSDKSFKRYRRFEALAKQGMKGLVIAAQAEEDRKRFMLLGAENVRVFGNMKFDISPPEAMISLGKKWRDIFRGRFVFLASSTREGEEEMILDAFAQMEILTIIVPRHPQRFVDVENMLKGRNISYAKRSDGVNPGGFQVLLGDSMGELFAYYSCCDIAFIGGSLLPFGGQNMIEAAAVGKPAIFGPHTFNFEQAARLAVEEGAALRIEDARDLAEKVSLLSRDPAKRDEMGNAGLLFVSRNRGATEKTLKLIGEALS